MAGTNQRAKIVTVDNAAIAAINKRFAIFCGEGLYVRSLARQTNGRISIGRDQARSFARDAAIAALHHVRRGGRRAWVVPHPGKLREVAQS